MKHPKNAGKLLLPLLFLLNLLLIYGIITREKPSEPAFAMKDRPVLILDAGHGGTDGGAVSASGLSESQVNLDIVLRMRELCRYLGLPCLLTRETEELDYPQEADTIAKMKLWDTRRRVEYINRQENAFLLSIHQNCYPSPKPRGPQIFFSPGDIPKKAAERIQNYMTENLYPLNRRVAAPIPKGIYIPEHAHCPTVLCECGFLSNPEEEALLSTAEYRTKIALILIGAYLVSDEENL